MGKSLWFYLSVTTVLIPFQGAREQWSWVTMEGRSGGERGADRRDTGR